jgi:NADPH-dependent 2,4-dienoyl-CoA reductase/sulfur reductase-like enzyme
MPELLVDGRRFEAPSGLTVAAALANAGVERLRVSVTGQPRGPLCVMGTCFECRVSIDGEPHRRACLEIVRDGMVVETGGPHPASQFSHPASRLPERTERFSADVAVVGAGPAGIAAACRAAEAGASTLVLDEGDVAGGQIYRHRPPNPPEAVRPWLERLERSGARRVGGASVFDAWRDDDGLRLLAETGGGALAVSARRLVLATGARELFLPFPGWTLPGSLGAGGVQALWKSGADLRGRTAVVAGSGPLLLPVAASLTKAGARVALVAEQASFASLAGFGASLARVPSKILEAVRHRRGFAKTLYRTGTWVARALGSDRVEVVAVTDGVRTRELACDLLAVGWGLVPNVELASLLGCAMREGAVAVDARQQTSVEGVLCAGEPCGVAGVEVALAEGEIAGVAAAGRRDPGAEPRLARTRASGRRLAARMHSAFRLRPELRALAAADTIVCRCEDVAVGAVAGCSGAREAKLSSRAGMGACQGRVCGPALRFLFGWDSDTVRPPARPARIGHLAASEE